MLSLVSIWMGDCMQAGESLRQLTSQLGQLSLLSSVGW